MLRCCAAWLSCCLAVVVFGAEADPRGDWGQWRGPQRNGISAEKGLLTQWDKDGPPLLWQASGLGGGYSSVAIVGDRIFTMGRRKNETVLLALKADDGSELWSTPVGSGEPNCTPTVDGNRVYCLARDGEFLCAQVESGAPIWRKSFSGDFGGKMMSGWGYSESPLIDGDRLICTPGSRDAMIVALDKLTGETVWTSEMTDAGTRGKDGAAYSSIVISEGAGVKQYVQIVGRGMIGVRASDGKLLWTYNKIANGTANIPTPIVKDDFVFCSTGYGTGAALVKLVKDGDGVAAEEQYFVDGNKLQNHHGGMILLGDYVYFGNKHNQGFPVCVDWKTGEVKWEPGRGPGSGSAAICYADGHLYFRYQSGDMALIEATPEKYVLKGSFRLASVKGQSWPHPVVVRGKMYLRDQDALMCYDVRIPSAE